MSIASRIAEAVKHGICTIVLFLLFAVIYAANKCFNISKGLK